MLKIIGINHHNDDVKIIIFIMPMFINILSFFVKIIGPGYVSSHVAHEGLPNVALHRVKLVSAILVNYFCKFFSIKLTYFCRYLSRISP